jgi:REP element-mobilizing transposase RayT
MSDEVLKWSRNLPHWEQRGATYFITFRVLEGELSPEERKIALDACLFWNGRRWEVDALVVMPDHVHLLARMCRKPDSAGLFLLAEVIHSVKSFSAHQIAKRRGRPGPIWQDERYDRIMRDEREFEEKLHYLANNPVKRELCRDYLEYPYFWYPRDQFGDQSEDTAG